jgi:hypothetical protein
LKELVSLMVLLKSTPVCSEDNSSNSPIIPFELTSLVEVLQELIKVTTRIKTETNEVLNFIFMD